jgi:hypothetical protein
MHSFGIANSTSEQLAPYFSRSDLQTFIITAIHITTAFSIPFKTSDNSPYNINVTNSETNIEPDYLSQSYVC